MGRFLSLGFRLAVAVGGIITPVGSVVAQDILADPGFESGTPVPSGAGGWAEINAASFSQTFAHNGQWSLMNAYNSSAVGLVVGATQTAPAAPGFTYAVSSWGFTPATLTGGQGLLLVDFLDSSQNFINSDGVFHTMGTLDASASTESWTFLSNSIAAPPNTA